MWPAEPIPGQGLYVALAIALILLAVLAAVRGATYDRAKGKPRCRKCGYPAHGIDATNKTSGGGGWSCPECGWSPKRAKDLLRVRRSRKWFVVSLLLLGCAWSSWYAIHVQFRRVKLNEPSATALTPTTWWIAVLPNRTGDEDLIVYHRAYPEGKLSGGVAGQFSLPGSGRTMPRPEPRVQIPHVLVLPGGEYAIPRWQHRWAVSQFERVMYDETETMGRRSDAAWQYAAFTGLAEDDEVEMLAGLLSVRDEELSGTVLDAYFWRDMKSPAVAAAAARVIEDDRYSDNLRWDTCEWLGFCGASCEPYVLNWIATDSVDSQYICETIAYASMWAQHTFQPRAPFLLRLLKAMFASEYERHHRDAILLLIEYYGEFWGTAEGTESMFWALKPELESILEEYNRPDRQAIAFCTSLFPERFQELHGGRDPRVYEAWEWLLAQPGDDVRLSAGIGIRDLAFQLDSSREDRAWRAKLLTIVEAGLADNPSDELRATLTYTLELLEDYEERAAQREADDAATAP